jgi:hypothetical protein
MSNMRSRNTDEVRDGLVVFIQDAVLEHRKNGQLVHFGSQCLVCRHLFSVPEDAMVAFVRAAELPDGWTS